MDDEPPGVPEWVVTYGDMMSLLLTFFIMLVSLSEVVADKKYRAILEALQQRIGYDTTPLAPEGDRFPLNAMVARLQELGSFTDSDAGRGGIRSDSAEGPELRVFRSREGAPLLVGQPVRFDSAGEALISSEDMVQLLADEVIGKPNRLELTTSVEIDQPESRMAGFRRAEWLRQELVKRHVDPERFRITLRIATEDDELTSAVGLHVLDTHVSDGKGPREPMSHQPADAVPLPAGP